LRGYNAAKCDCGRGSDPDPTGRAYSASSDTLAVLRGCFVAGRGRERKGSGREGRGREREERGRGR